MRNNYYGFGKEDSMTNKYTISLFFGNCYLTIAFYTKKYKLIPRFYFYSKESFTYMKEIEMFRIKWFFGIIF